MKKAMMFCWLGVTVLMAGGCELDPSAVFGQDSGSNAYEPSEGYGAACAESREMQVETSSNAQGCEGVNNLELVDRVSQRQGKLEIAFRRLKDGSLPKLLSMHFEQVTGSSPGNARPLVCAQSASGDPTIRLYACYVEKKNNDGSNDDFVLSSFELSNEKCSAYAQFERSAEDVDCPTGTYQKTRLNGYDVPALSPMDKIATE
jgi:hypothetical protein